MTTALDVDVRLGQGSFQLAVRFTAPGDGITALFGPSGSGKSTLLSVLAGLKRIESGRIALGRRIYDDSSAKIYVAPHRRSIGLVFQDARLFPHLTARQNIAFAARRAPQGTHRDMEDLARFFDIMPLLDRPVGNLSGGEKSRVALARALASAPTFLLLDEPFSALDGVRRRSFIQVLLAMHQTYHLPMMVVTHDIDDAAALASHVIALQDGRVAIAGPFAEVTRKTEFQTLLDPRDVGAAMPSGRLRGVRENATAGSWLRADHVLLASERPGIISARNIIDGRVIATFPETDSAVLVEVETAMGIILARVTSEAASELRLAPGTPVWAIVKAHLV